MKRISSAFACPIAQSQAAAPSAGMQSLASLDPAKRPALLAIPSIKGEGHSAHHWCDDTSVNGTAFHAPATTPCIAAFRSINGETRSPLASPQISSVRCGDVGRLGCLSSQVLGCMRPRVNLSPWVWARGCTALLLPQEP